jgi:hypothetical protein
MVEYRPEAEHIASIVRRVSGESLGTRILARFRSDWKRNSCLSERGVELESDEFDLISPVTRSGYKNGVGREIAMNESSPMRCLQAGGHLEGEIQCFRKGEDAPRRQELR